MMFRTSGHIICFFQYKKNIEVYVNIRLKKNTLKVKITPYKYSMILFIVNKKFTYITLFNLFIYINIVE